MYEWRKRSVKKKKEKRIMYIPSLSAQQAFLRASVQAAYHRRGENDRVNENFGRFTSVREPFFLYFPAGVGTTRYCKDVLGRSQITKGGGRPDADRWKGGWEERVRERGKKIYLKHSAPSPVFYRVVIPDPANSLLLSSPSASSLVRMRMYTFIRSFLLSFCTIKAVSMVSANYRRIKRRD